MRTIEPAILRISPASAQSLLIIPKYELPFNEYNYGDHFKEIIFVSFHKQ
jgi:hypothetical protein